MAPPIKLRVNYNKDGQYLQRLRDAVTKEDRISPEIRKSMLGHIEGLIRNMIDADKELREQEAESEASDVA